MKTTQLYRKHNGRSYSIALHYTLMLIWFRVLISENFTEDELIVLCRYLP